MKTIVVNEKENTRVPFLRGILIRNLLDTGLRFEDAFEIATRVRNDLSESGEIDTQELRRRVAAMLEKKGWEDELELFQASTVAPARILVTTLSGTSSAFSRGKHERYLQASGMKPDKAEQTTA